MHIASQIEDENELLSKILLKAKSIGFRSGEKEAINPQNFPRILPDAGFWC